MNKTRLTAIFLILFLLALSVQGKPRRRHKVKQHPKSTSTRVESGVWGGAHARLHVTDIGGGIEYDCAHGTVSGPLVLDAQGRFSVMGTHTRERPGPIRIGLTPASVPARYAGSVEGQTLTLTVTLTDDQTIIGTFTLTQGSGGRLWKCK